LPANSQSVLAADRDDAELVLGTGVIDRESAILGKALQLID
jgi:hypothetical protein